MTQATLLSDIFPRGVVLRMTAENGRFTIRWQFREQPYSIEASTIEEGMKEALQAIQALEQEDGPV